MPPKAAKPPSAKGPSPAKAPSPAPTKAPSPASGVRPSRNVKGSKVAPAPEEEVEVKKAEKTEVKKQVEIVNGAPPERADGNWEPPQKELVVPPEQLKLTPEELKEEITKTLTANNPFAPHNIARFTYKERQFKFDPMVDQTMVHFSSDGWMLNKDSEEAGRQMELERQEADARAAFEARARKPAGGEDELVDDSMDLRNSFNFSERAAQTYNNPTRDRATATEPPHTNDFCGMATQWAIFDGYMEDQERQRLNKELRKNKGTGASFTDGPRKSMSGDGNAGTSGSGPPRKEETESVVHNKAMSKAVKVVERMVNQNSFDDIAQDFKYWEDASDAFRDGEGTCLPLWKFYTERAKRKHVTAIAWNPEFVDLFAVGYGSFDFVRQTSGLICCYSLKNPSHPEYTFTTESGVMCLDFHPQHSSLLAVGLYDGTVLVYDVRNKINRPIFASTVKTGKHTDPVWQVRWQEEDLSKSLNFFSVSSDGRVTLWTMSKSELQFHDVMELKLSGNVSDTDLEEDETALGSLAGGCSLDFNQHSEHLFIVGTEEGRIHKCSKAYHSQYLETYKGHSMAVYTVQWNPWHPKVFLSASADWTVKLWEHTNPKPVMSFDLNNGVSDVTWAPFSATTFAAVTSDGKVHVFDLNENKHEPMCEQKIVRKAKLTRVSFNPKHPILLVGDDRGCVTCLKLSPNLRKSIKPHASKEVTQEQVAKLDKIIEVALKGE